MSGPKRPLSVTPAQATYLRELIDDDMALTKLTINEYQQARSLLNKLDGILDDWPEARYLEEEA